MYAIDADRPIQRKICPGLRHAWPFTFQVAPILRAVYLR